MKPKITAVFSLTWMLSHHCAGFSIPSGRENPSSTQKSTTPSSIDVQLQKSNPNIRRRELTKSIASSLLSAGLFGATAGIPERAAWATSDGATVWKTGRAPEVPGQKPKDKGDTRGTKKDPNFLRSVADCKGKCENSYGPDGLARSSAECLSACQDICCTTYEQCTFAIVPR
ncbi:hypothetical protein ACHAWX_006454 [Stephanocyclus meneghinianus]